MEQVIVARECGADGVFLISHNGKDDEVLTAALFAKSSSPDFAIGINLLSHSAMSACMEAKELELSMVWADQMGVDSQGLTEKGRMLSKFALENPSVELFASVAFKYQAIERDPAGAARNAVMAGFTPTTSGDATGVAPALQKVAKMMLSSSGRLALASGITPTNVHDYAPLVGAVLVSTGISQDEFRINPKKLLSLMDVVRNGRMKETVPAALGLV